MWKPGIVSNVFSAFAGVFGGTGLRKAFSSASVWVRAPGSFNSGNSSSAILCTSSIAAQSAVFANLEQDVPRSLEVIDEHGLLIKLALLLRDQLRCRASSRGRRAKPDRRAAARRARRRPGLCARRHSALPDGRRAERAGRDPRRFAQARACARIRAIAPRPDRRGLSKSTRPCRSRSSCTSLTGATSLRTRIRVFTVCGPEPSRSIRSPGGLPSTSRQEQRPRRDEAASGRRAVEPGLCCSSRRAFARTCGNRRASGTPDSRWPPGTGSDSRYSEADTNLRVPSRGRCRTVTARRHRRSPARRRRKSSRRAASGRSRRGSKTRSRHVRGSRGPTGRRAGRRSRSPACCPAPGPCGNTN